MIQISDTLSIPEDELDFSFMRSSGPGGQNVNKVSSAVQLRFDVSHSPSLPADVKKRLTALAGARMNQDGVLQINASRFRSQLQNKRDALQRFITLVLKAQFKPKKRIRTGPTTESKLRRLAQKTHRARIKKQRTIIDFE
ncbi:aminoacyl-tRNA hydrolase [bacterium]|nr:aminoacyl-tRNA hydrolase [bacterium]